MTNRMCLTPMGVCGKDGGQTMNGYCFLHDRTYKIVEPDDVCPECLAAKEQDLEWRTENDDE